MSSCYETLQIYYFFLVVDYTHNRICLYHYPYLSIIIHASVNIVLFGIRHDSIDDNLSVLYIIQSYIKYRLYNNNGTSEFNFHMEIIIN